jgi:hypothetical protein
MKNITNQQQDDILYTMKHNIDNIRSTRYETGEEHPQHQEIWQEIESMYNKLDRQHKEEFNCYIN